MCARWCCASGEGRLSEEVATFKRELYQNVGTRDSWHAASSVHFYTSPLLPPHHRFEGIRNSIFERNAKMLQKYLCQELVKHNLKGKKKIHIFDCKNVLDSCSRIYLNKNIIHIILSSLNFDRNLELDVAAFLRVSITIIINSIKLDTVQKIYNSINDEKQKKEDFKEDSAGGYKGKGPSKKSEKVKLRKGEGQKKVQCGPDTLSSLRRQRSGGVNTPYRKTYVKKNRHTAATSKFYIFHTLLILLTLLTLLTPLIRMTSPIAQTNIPALELVERTLTKLFKVLDEKNEGAERGG